MTFAPSHILVPVAIDPDEDFALAEHAVFAACDIAEKFSSKITLLYLAGILVPGGGASVDVSGKIYKSFMQVLKNRLDRGRERLEELKDVVQGRGVSVEGRVVDSLEKTASVILESAEEMGADLVVIGSHGRKGLSRVLFGSVAEKVAKDATIPVLLLHPKKEKQEPK